VKGYLAKWKIRDAPESHITDYWFNSKIENAAHWTTEEQAEIDCAMLNKLPITIPSSEGGLHSITDFKVEKRAEEEFVIFCDAPFIPTETGTSEAQQPK
jgi:hypothetical protein